uniref:SRCR domain-containing protein n=1 Tax=Meleagris gallopavo TaxID=9103 RepID=A0A803XNN1_MELGA
MGTARAAAHAQRHENPGRWTPLGDTQAVSPVVGLRDARSGDKPHIWARSRLLEAGTRQAADNPADNGSHRTSPSPLAPASRGCCLYLPLPILSCRLCMWGMMMPAGVLGLLFCVQLCMGSEELRLVDGGGRCAGRVEVKHEGEWGSVCSYDIHWDTREAGVVCRQLGCGTVAHTSPNAPFGQGKGRIWLHPYFCDGTESTLQDCSHLGWGKHFCGHEWDVGVICSGELVYLGLEQSARTSCAELRPISNAGAEALELRLVDGEGPCKGRVEVKLRGRWGTVYDDAWNMDDAEVVCQQLGCGSAAHTKVTSQLSEDHNTIMLVYINCDGNEKAIWDCNIKHWGPYNSPVVYNASVVCQGFSRLVGGDSECSGRLEVRQGRAWVSVCHGHVDLMAAQVVCRELGCGTALALYGTGHFGAADGTFWDGAFECNGTEPLLSACTQRPPDIQNCTQPAAVICSCKCRGCGSVSAPRSAVYMGEGP